MHTRANTVTPYKTTCSYCGVGCGIIVRKDSKGRLQVEGDPEHPVNRGVLCSKGRNLHYVVEDKSDRLLYPEMRWNRHMPLQRVSWEQALERTAAVFKALMKKYGPDSVGFYVSGQCLTEEYYLVNKLTKGFLGTNNIDTNSRLCMSSAVAGYKKALGDDIVPGSYDDIEKAGCFLIAGANPAWCHPILFRRIEQHKEQNPEVKLIVVDPRKTQTCALADIHLQIRPGTDIILYHAMARYLIEQDWVDWKFIARHTEGFESLKQVAFERDLDEAARRCEVPVEQIKEAARYIGEANGFLSMWAMGVNQSVVGVNKNLALLNLSLITGQIGKPGAGPFSLTGQPNAMGGREVGGMASLLAAHLNPANPEHRQKVADFWGVKSLSTTSGLTATEMFEALAEGKMKAIWIICTNPMVSLPNSNLVEKALQKARFVVVQDISKKADTLAYADVVLPAAGWGEKEGTMTNSERRISYLSKFTEAPGEARPDVEILWDFARKMDFEGFDYQSPAEVFNEHCRLTQGTKIDISGLGYERLQRERSIQWPVPDKKHPGTPRLFTDHRFYTGNERARIFGVPSENASETTTPDFPLVLITGRIRDQWHTMTRTGKVSRLNQHISQPFVEIHPEDAHERGLKNGQVVEVYNSRGRVRVTVKITGTIKRGVVFLPMHWGKVLNKSFARANNLTSNRVDPVSKEPDFKYSTVQVLPYQKPKEKVIVVGAGAAAYRFIHSYRELNTRDEIHVFSKEPYPFYNRVLLPEYVNEHLVWEKLLKFKKGEFEKLNVHLHKGVSIEAINRQQKTVTDAKGSIHVYDKLIIATGSRAFVPKDVPLHLPGILTMRSRADADALKQCLEPGGKVLVVGGGLLGLELAASLREIAIDVTLVQLASRLMERQLDVIASDLLREVVDEMGVDIFFNDQVQTIFPKNTSGFVVRLKSGKTIPCDAVVYAIGTRPNIELAKEAGLKCQRGVVVNAYLQSSDPDIYAMGEIAEFRNVLNGITAAAEEQADYAARHLAGDLANLYKGSLFMNILKFSNLDLCSLGMVEIPEKGEGYEEVVFMDRSQRYYKKCIVYQDRLVGAILMGDKSEFAEFKDLIESGMELSEKRLKLLRSEGKTQAVLGTLVCSCNNVGEGNLRQEIEKGCNDFRQLCKLTGAGTGCGSCKPEVKAVLESCQQAMFT
ncbi:molybdopterin-dependent oxidoreductase [Rapidithrix thailandica]|uniref:nitrate reductase (cytochrome) n=1 Tax=Rapidithrix thailandica TaxID=413964 RepID=A0AAW9S3K6_9BACT